MDVALGQLILNVRTWVCGIFLVLSFMVVKGLLQLPTLRLHSELEEGMALGLFPFIWEANFPTSLQHTCMYMPLAVSSRISIPGHW